jgi:hypothetical protein
MTVGSMKENTEKQKCLCSQLLYLNPFIKKKTKTILNILIDGNQMTELYITFNFSFLFFYFFTYFYNWGGNLETLSLSVIYFF